MQEYWKFHLNITFLSVYLCMLIYLKMFNFLKKLILLFIKAALNWLKVTVKDIYNVTKDFYFK